MSLGASVVSVLSSPIKMVALTAGLGGVVLSAGGVFTVLNAQASNATAQSVSTGTLKMSLTTTGGGGLNNTVPITGMKPGDTVNRYVTLTNTGTLDMSNLTLLVTGSGTTPLTTDSSRGLQITVRSCSVAWVGGLCSGGAGVAELASTPVNGMTATALTTLTSLAASGTSNLKVSITLPDSSECNINNDTSLVSGNCDSVTALTVANSVQDKSTNLTFAFRGTQGTGTTTNS